jgi:hypothetical protein
MKRLRGPAGHNVCSLACRCRSLLSAMPVAMHGYNENEL